MKNKEQRTRKGTHLAAMGLLRFIQLNNSGEQNTSGQTWIKTIVSCVLAMSERLLLERERGSSRGRLNPSGGGRLLRFTRKVYLQEVNGLLQGVV